MQNETTDSAASATTPCSRQTLAYSPRGYEGQYLEAFPVIHGMKCTGWSASDLFEDYDDAMTVLAKIATADLDYGEAEKMAREFFELKKESTYTYYDPDEEEDPLDLGENK